MSVHGRHLRLKQSYRKKLLKRTKSPKKDKGRCAICHLKKPLTEHHKIPRREGGTSNRDNIQYLCRDCHDKVDGIVRRVKWIIKTEQR